jgi:hypothetical protein
MIAVRQLLRTLADVEGTIGSFVLSDSGGLLVTDLPATFDAAAFAEAGPRIIRLTELGGSYSEPTRFFVIRFAEYKLYVRVLKGAFLGVLVTPSASLPALKAAAGVIGRRVEALLAKGADAVADTVQSPPRFASEPPPRFVEEPVPPRSIPDSRISEPAPPSAPPARAGSAIGAPPALTNTQPSITLPASEHTSPGVGPRRSIRYRGRQM